MAMERGFYHWCVVITQIMVVNLLLVLTSLPLVTAPASVAAAFTVFRRMLDPDSEPTFAALVRCYFSAFASDRRSSVGLTAFAALLLANGWVLWAHQGGRLLAPACIVFGVFAGSWFLTATLVATYYRMPLFHLLRTSLFVMLANLYRCVPLVLAGWFVLYLELKSPAALIALGLGLPLYLFFRANRTPVVALRDLVASSEVSEPAFAGSR